MYPGETENCEMCGLPRTCAPSSELDRTTNKTETYQRRVPEQGTKDASLSWLQLVRLGRRMACERVEKWSRKANNSMKFGDRKIATILDNFSCHPKLTSSHVKLFILSHNTISITQTMDAGIIKNLNHHYRRVLVRKRLLAVDSETEFKLDLLQALDWLKMSWDNTTPAIIKHCYQHVGFKDELTTEDTTASDTSIRRSSEEAGLVSGGLH